MVGTGGRTSVAGGGFGRAGMAGECLSLWADLDEAGL